MGSCGPAPLLEEHRGAALLSAKANTLPGRVTDTQSLRLGQAGPGQFRGDHDILSQPGNSERLLAQNRYRNRTQAEEARRNVPSSFLLLHIPGYMSVPREALPDPCVRPLPFPAPLAFILPPRTCSAFFTLSTQLLLACFSVSWQMSPSPFYRGGSQGSEKVGDLFKGTEGVAKPRRRRPLGNRLFFPSTLGILLM